MCSFVQVNVKDRHLKRQGRLVSVAHETCVLQAHQGQHSRRQLSALPEKATLHMDSFKPMISDVDFSRKESRQG